jgi:hypothetical protein
MEEINLDERKIMRSMVALYWESIIIDQVLSSMIKGEFVGNFVFIDIKVR